MLWNCIAESSIEKSSIGMAQQGTVLHRQREAKLSFAEDKQGEELEMLRAVAKRIGDAPKRYGTAMFSTEKEKF